MPAILRLALDLSQRPVVYPARLHGAGCAITGTHGTGHTGPPFTVGPLHDHNGHTWWRLGWLADTEPPPLPAKVVFGDTHCAVTPASSAYRVGFAQLAATAPAAHASLRVVSPLYFSRNGTDHPLPDPALTIRSLATRWNQHAPDAVAITTEQTRVLINHIYLAAFDGRTEQAPISATMTQTGFVGVVHLALRRSADRSTRVTFAALTHFAEIAGIGAQTTHGFGAVDLLELA